MISMFRNSIFYITILLILFLLCYIAYYLKKINENLKKERLERFNKCCGSNNTGIPSDVVINSSNHPTEKLLDLQSTTSGFNNINYCPKLNTQCHDM